MIKLIPNDELELAIEQVGIFSKKKKKKSNSVQKAIKVKGWHFGGTILVKFS